MAVIIERLVYYNRRSKFSRTVILDQIRKEFIGHHVLNAIGLCKNIDTPVSKVALAGLNLHGHDEKLISNAMETGDHCSNDQIGAFYQHCGKHRRDRGVHRPFRHGHWDYAGL